MEAGKQSETRHGGAPTPLASTILGRLADAYESARDPGRAEQMTAYMRGQFTFLGIASTPRRALDREVLACLAKPSEADVAAVVNGCWALPEREYQYFGQGYARRYVKACSPAFLGTAEHAITTAPWWDTVDELAQNVVGPLVLAFPELRAVMDAWVESPDMWLRRTAILHQNKFEDRTDAEVLFRYCLARAAEKEFFIRKAIGWALRDFSRVDPGAVRGFVAAHDAELSGLSKREALRHT